MSNVVKEDGIPVEEARIVQASVMDDKTVLLSFSNGTSALVSSEDLRKLVVQSRAEVVIAERDIDSSSDA